MMKSLLHRRRISLLQSALLLVVLPSACNAYFLDQPEIQWTLGTDHEVLRGNSVQATRNGQHVFATSSDGSLLILSNLNGVGQQSDSQGTGKEKSKQQRQGGGGGSSNQSYEPTVYAFEPPRVNFEAELYCESGVVLVDDFTSSTNAQFAVFGVTEQYIGTERSYVMAVDTNGNLILSSPVLDGAIMGTPVVLGNYLYVVHNENNNVGRVSILALDRELELVDTVSVEESFNSAGRSSSGPFAPAAGRELIQGNNVVHVLVFGASTQQGTSPFGNLYMLVANVDEESFDLKVVSTVPGATLHEPALSEDATQAFLGSYAAGVNGWNSNRDLSGVLDLDGPIYNDIFPAWMQRFQGDYFNPNAPIPVTPVLNEDETLLFIAGASSDIFCLETSQGRTQWNLETEGLHTARPIVSYSSEEQQEMVYFIERDSGMVRQMDTLQDRGRVNWEQDCGEVDGVPCSAVEADFAVSSDQNVLYYADVEGRIHALQVAEFESAIVQQPVAPPPTFEPTTAPTAIVEATLTPTLVAVEPPAMVDIPAGDGGSDPDTPSETDVGEGGGDTPSDTTTTTTDPGAGGNDGGTDTTTSTNPGDSSTNPGDSTSGGTDSNANDGNNSSNQQDGNSGGIRGAGGNTPAGTMAVEGEAPPPRPSTANKSYLSSIFHEDLPMLLGVVAAVLAVSVLVIGFFVMRRRRVNHKQQREQERRNSQELSAANRWQFNWRVYEEECRLEEAETLSELSRGSGNGKGGRKNGNGGGFSRGRRSSGSSNKKKKRRKSRNKRGSRQQQANSASSPATALDSIVESVDESDNEGESFEGGDDEEMACGSEDENAGFEIAMDKRGTAKTKPVTKRNLDAAMAAAAGTTAATSSSDPPAHMVSPDPILELRHDSCPSPPPPPPPPLPPSHPVRTTASSPTNAPRPAPSNASSPPTEPRPQSPLVALASAVKAAAIGTAVGVGVAVASPTRNDDDNVSTEGASMLSCETEEPGRIRVNPRPPQQQRPVSPQMRPASPDPSCVLSVDDSLYIEGKSVASKSVASKSVASGKFSVRTSKSMKSHPDDESNYRARPPTPTNMGVATASGIPPILGSMNDNDSVHSNPRDVSTRAATTAAPVARRVPPVVVSHQPISPTSSDHSGTEQQQPRSLSAAPPPQRFEGLGGREAALRGSSVRAPRAGLFTRRARPVEDYRAFASVVDDSDESEDGGHRHSNTLPAGPSSRRKDRDGSGGSKASNGKDMQGKQDMWSSFLTELSKAEEQFFNPDIPKASSNSKGRSSGSATGRPKRRIETRTDSPPQAALPQTSPNAPPPPPAMHGEKMRLDTTVDSSFLNTSSSQDSATSESHNSQSSDGSALEL